MCERKKIIFIHSLNNYTGSPNVLSVIIKDFLQKGYKVSLITSRGKGFLSGIEGIHYHYTIYKLYVNNFFSLISLLVSQMQTFFMVLFLKKDSIIYVNTIVPFGAAWACFLTGKTFVYHVHEDMRLKKPLYGFYRYTYKHCNRKNVFVSRYLEDTACNLVDSIVVYNSLDSEFVRQAKVYIQSSDRGKGNVILMVASLRKFKGINEFIVLSKRLPCYDFNLVVSESEVNTGRFISKNNIPPNLKIYSVQADLSPFYMKARILLNLTHIDEWIETFGLTLLEAMTYGIPVIAPPAGGPLEIVRDGQNGFLIDSYNMDELVVKVNQLMTNENLYNRLSENALSCSGKFNSIKMTEEIEKVISGM